MEKTEKENTDVAEGFDVETFEDGVWCSNMDLLTPPVINLFHKSIEDARKAIRKIKESFPSKKCRIYHWITTTTTKFVGEEEWIEEG